MGVSRLRRAGLLQVRAYALIPSGLAYDQPCASLTQRASRRAVSHAKTPSAQRYAEPRP
jgi:hypothetical protein